MPKAVISNFILLLAAIVLTTGCAGRNQRNRPNVDTANSRVNPNVERQRELERALEDKGNDNDLALGAAVDQANANFNNNRRQNHAFKVGEDLADDPEIENSEDPSVEEDPPVALQSQEQTEEGEVVDLSKATNAQLQAYVDEFARFPPSNPQEEENLRAVREEQELRRHSPSQREVSSDTTHGSRQSASSSDDFARGARGLGFGQSSRTGEMGNGLSTQVSSRPVDDTQK